MLRFLEEPDAIDRAIDAAGLDFAPTADDLARFDTDGIAAYLRSRGYTVTKGLVPSGPEPISPEVFFAGCGLLVAAACVWMLVRRWERYKSAIRAGGFACGLGLLVVGLAMRDSRGDYDDEWGWMVACVGAGAVLLGVTLWPWMLGAERFITRKERPSTPGATGSVPVVSAGPQTSS